MRTSLAATTVAVLLALSGAACGADDGADVRTIGGSDAASGASGSASGSASVSASGSGSSSTTGTAADDAPVEQVAGDGGYEYATDVAAHRLVTRDVCDVIAALDQDPVDFAAAAEAYRSGGSSPSDGGFRTLHGFASADDRNHGLGEHLGSATPLDDFVGDALTGSGSFADEPVAVRVQGVEKGIQNQVMVAWTVHELRSALAKAVDGDLDPEEGAVHNWDEAWAFYHGAEPGCAPYATADKRAADFGTTGDGDIAVANERILAAMVAGRDALLAEDVAAAQEAADVVMRELVVTYSQATLKYTEVAAEDVAAGDDATARVHQAEGLAFFRVVEAYLAEAGADTDAVLAVLALDAEAPAEGDGDTVREALQPAWDALGITSDDIGSRA